MKPRLVGIARNLRRKQTPAEKILWKNLSRRQMAGLKFRRQQPVGRYIVDFVCFEQNFVIEVDGGHHGTKENLDRDKNRDAWLEQEGYRVIRVSNRDVKTNLDGVLQTIYSKIKRE